MTSNQLVEIVMVALLVVGVLGLIGATSLDITDADAWEKRFMTAARVGLAVLGIAGAGLRAWPTLHKPDDTIPVVDATTLGFLALIVVAVILPRVSKLTIGGTTVELAAQAAKELKDATDDLSELVQNWSTSLAGLVERLAEGEDVADIQVLYFNFVRDRLGELKLNIGSLDGNVRIAFWLYDESTRELVFTYSNEIRDEATRAKRFGFAEGLLGQAFEEQRFWNEGKATQLPSFVPVGPQTRYSSVCAAPVTLLQERLGMLSVDKLGDTAFTERSSNLIIGCARILAVATEAYYTALAELVILDQGVVHDS
jgi:hypothetical protein